MDDGLLNPPIQDIRVNPSGWWCYSGRAQEEDPRCCYGRTRGPCLPRSQGPHAAPVHQAPEPGLVPHPRPGRDLRPRGTGRQARQRHRPPLDTRIRPARGLHRQGPVRSPGDRHGHPARGRGPEMQLRHRGRLPGGPRPQSGQDQGAGDIGAGGVPRRHRDRRGRVPRQREHRAQGGPAPQRGRPLPRHNRRGPRRGHPSDDG